MIARRLRFVLIAMLAIAASVVCVRLGLWQLARRRQKHALHVRQRELLAAPAIEVASVGLDPPQGRRVHLAGRWDRVHILLSGRTHLGAAGVSLVTPLRLESGGAVLIERGWLPAADACTAHPEEMGGGRAEVVGVSAPLARTANPPRWAAIAAESAGVTLWSARAPEADSVAARVRGPVAAWMVRALPDEQPRRPAAGRVNRRADDAVMVPLVEPLEVPDETMHLSYAIQWFGFAAVIAFGSLSLAVRSARQSRAGRG